MTSSKHKLVTDARLHRDHYDLMERERELLQNRWRDMPNDIPAIMNPAQAAEYLDVTPMTLIRWQKRGVLMPIVNPSNRRKRYLLCHLWVFKVLLLDGDNDDTN